MTVSMQTLEMNHAQSTVGIQNNLHKEMSTSHTDDVVSTVAKVALAVFVLSLLTPVILPVAIGAVILLCSPLPLAVGIICLAVASSRSRGGSGFWGRSWVHRRRRPAVVVAGGHKPHISGHVIPGSGIGKPHAIHHGHHHPKKPIKVVGGGHKPHVGGHVVPGGAKKPKGPVMIGGAHKPAGGTHFVPGGVIH